MIKISRLQFFKNYKLTKPVVTQADTTSKYFKVQTAEDLTATEERQSIIRKIKRQVSVTEHIWKEHYLSAIYNFCELVQELPASELHHHSSHGGLIDHTLETTLAGLKISQGYVLPPNSEPEDIAASSEKWRYGAFISILTHDLGKVVTDIEVVYRLGPKDQFQRWNSWYGNMPTGAEYCYRFMPKINNSQIAKNLHEKTGITLLPRIIKKEAAIWLFEDMELISQMVNTVTHSSFGGHVIAEIVKKADSSSVAKNLGAGTGTNVHHTTNTPLHEKIVISLRKLINDGELKRNRPGAAMWITEEDTWLVSKASMEAVRIQLQNEGHSGIPKNVIRLFETLKDHKIIIPTNSDESVWQAEVMDHAKNWNQKLTFLRFPNAILWPTTNPELFDGVIKPIGQDEAIYKTVDKLEPKEDIKITNEEKVYQEVADTSAKVKSLVPESIIKPEERIESKKSTQLSNPPILEYDTRSATKPIDLSQNDFFNWLINGVERRSIRVNEPKAPIHILENYIALVTPAIFNLYFDKNPIKKKLYEGRAENKKIYTFIQKEIEALGIHQMARNGHNINKMNVEGDRSASELMVYLLFKENFPCFKNFAPNKAMKIDINQ